MGMEAVAVAAPGGVSKINKEWAQKTWKDVSLAGQYEGSKTGRYEWMFGQGFISSGGQETMESWKNWMWIPENGVVMVIGGGLGGEAAWIKSQWPSCRVIAVDVMRDFAQNSWQKWGGWLADAAWTADEWKSEKAAWESVNGSWESVWATQWAKWHMENPTWKSENPEWESANWSGDAWWWQDAAGTWWRAASQWWNESARMWESTPSWSKNWEKAMKWLSEGKQAGTTPVQGKKSANWNADWAAKWSKEESDIMWVWADANEMSWPEKTVDFIFSRDTVLHMTSEKKKELWTKARSWCKPSTGNMLITDYSAPDWQQWDEGMKKYMATREYHLHPTWWSTSLMADAGWQVDGAWDNTNEWKKLLQRELKNLNDQKKNFLKEWSESDYAELSAGWTDKIDRVGRGMQGWGVWHAWANTPSWSPSWTGNSWSGSEALAWAEGANTPAWNTPAWKNTSSNSWNFNNPSSQNFKAGEWSWKN